MSENGHFWQLDIRTRNLETKEKVAFSDDLCLVVGMDAQFTSLI